MVGCWVQKVPNGDEVKYRDCRAESSLLVQERVRSPRKANPETPSENFRVNFINRTTREATFKRNWVTCDGSGEGREKDYGENTTHMKRQCANLVTTPCGKSYSSPYFQSCPCGKLVLLVNSKTVLRSTSPSRGSLVEKKKSPGSNQRDPLASSYAESQQMPNRVLNSNY